MNKHIVAFAAIIISCVIGASMSGSSAATGIVQSNKTYAMADITSSAVSSAVESEVSSAVSSSVSSAVSNTVSSAVSSAVSSKASSTPLVVGVTDNTTERNADLQSENDRHTTRLNELNALYDPQITALQTEIDGFTAENARDTTTEIAKLQSDYDTAKLNYHNYLIYHQISYPRSDYEFEFSGFNAVNSTKYLLDTKTPILEQLKLDYATMQSDVSRILYLNSQKSDIVSNENMYHVGQTNLINTLLP